MDKTEKTLKFKEITSIEIPIELVDENVTKFVEIVKSMAELYAKKNHDYGNSFDEGCAKIGTGYPLGRLLDKMNSLDKIQYDTNSFLINYIKSPY